MNFEELYNNLTIDFPLLSKLSDTEQDSVWHSEGNVYIHTKMVYNEIINIINEYDINDDDKEVLLISAVLHDIGKPIVTKEKELDDRIAIVSPKHEYIGMSYIFHKIQNLNLKNEQIEKILGIVGYHNLPKLYTIDNKSKWKFINLSTKAPTELLYLFEIADIKGRICPDKEYQLEILELFKMYCLEYECFSKNILKRPSFYDNEYLDSKTYKALLNNEIFMPEEGEQKYYSHKEKYSNLIILTGLSGVGKSYFIEKQYPDYYLISLDNIRDDFNKREDLSNEGQVRQEAKRILKEKLAAKENIIYDATNIRRDFRKQIIDLGNQYHALVKTICLTDKINNILKRNKDRKYAIPDSTILKQEQKFEFPEKDEADNSIIIFK